MLDTSYVIDFTSIEIARLNPVITAGQLKAARALLGIEQKTLAELAGVSLPTIQRMEASDGTVRGNVETLTKVVEALDRAGIELLYIGGRGVRLRERGGDG